MLALVTGANGFVGSHLVDALLREGHEVRALVRRSSNLKYLDTQRCQLFYADLVSGEAPDAALEDVDWVFHSAALLHGRSWEEIRLANVDASIALYRRFANHAGADARFVFISSQAAAGPSHRGWVRSEEDPPRPQSLYGRSKLEAEVALSALSGPALSLLRPPAVYGPRDTATLPLFRLARHGWAFCTGSRDREISMVHVDDLVRGILQSASHPAGVGTFFLTDGKPHPWSEIADALAAATQRRVRIVTVPDLAMHAAGALNEGVHRLRGRSALFDRAKALDFTAKGWACSSEAAGAAFGFAPRVELVEGMAATMEWYRREAWL